MTAAVPTLALLSPRRTPRASATVKAVLPSSDPASSSQQARATVNDSPGGSVDRWVAPRAAERAVAPPAVAAPSAAGPQQELCQSLSAFLRQDAVGRDLLRALLREVEQMERFEHARRVL